MSVKKNDVRCARECTGTRLFVATTYHGQYLTMRHRQIEVKGRGAMPMLSVASSCWFAVCGKNEPRRARRVDKQVSLLQRGSYLFLSDEININTSFRNSKPDIDDVSQNCGKERRHRQSKDRTIHVHV